MESTIPQKKLEKYFSLSSRALNIAKKNINKSKKQEAGKIIEIASCYLSDAKFFERNKDYVNAFAAINYAHGWLDCGARLGIFDVKDTTLFTIK